MTDVLLFQTLNDGDVEYKDGDLTTSAGLETAVYLSLFGGNKEDRGLSDTTKTWWPNLAEVDPASQYRSETQYLIDTLVLIPANLVRIQDAVLLDLQWLKDEGIAFNINALASIPNVDRLQLDIAVDSYNFTFLETISNGR